MATYLTLKLGRYPLKKIQSSHLNTVDVSASVGNACVVGVHCQLGVTQITGQVICVQTIKMQETFEGNKNNKGPKILP